MSKNGIFIVSFFFAINSISFGKDYFCVGELDDGKEVFIVNKIKRLPSGNYKVSKIDLYNAISLDARDNYELLEDLTHIKTMQDCPTRYIFPSMCRTVSNKDNPNYFYLFLNNGLRIRQYGFNHRVLKLAVNMVNDFPGNTNHRFSYGHDGVTPTYKGLLINCSHNW